MQNITWSVSIEEQFYLLWPLFFLFTNPKKWLQIIIILIICSLIFRIYNYSDSTILYFHTLSVLMDLALGGFLAFIVHYNSKVKSYLENANFYHKIIPIIIALIFLFWKEYLFEIKYFEAISRIFISILFAFVIACQSLSKNETNADFGKFKFAEKWGKYTYGIYLIHPIALTVATFLFSRINYIKDFKVLNIILYVLFSLILTLVLSKISYKYYESIFLKIKKKL